jgi:predicted  nucleic acid-binding Zn-ribbon protein
MAWACERCDTLHTQNPAECRDCGHNIFKPVSDAELRRRSTGTESPESMSEQAVQTMGTSSKPDMESSPDVAIDGSIAGDATSDSMTSLEQDVSSSSARSIFHKVRATVRAPFGLLRRYFIPILAFGLVFGIVAYLLV